MLGFFYKLPIKTSDYQTLRAEYRAEDENYLRYALIHGFDRGAKLEAASAVHAAASAECADERAEHVA